MRACGCSKRSQRLGDHWKRGVPVEVLPMAYRSVQLTIEGRHGGTAPLRLAKQKAVRRAGHGNTDRRSD